MIALPGGWFAGTLGDAVRMAETCLQESPL